MKPNINVAVVLLGFIVTSCNLAPTKDLDAELSGNSPRLDLSEFTALHTDTRPGDVVRFNAKWRANRSALPTCLPIYHLKQGDNVIALLSNSRRDQVLSTSDLPQGISEFTDRVALDVPANTSMGKYEIFVTVSEGCSLTSKDKPSADGTFVLGSATITTSPWWFGEGTPPPPQLPPSQPQISNTFAHAGGRVRELNYTNSREALETNYANGFRSFEIDFEWTLDNHLVLLHDWYHIMDAIYTAPEGAKTLEEFLKLRMKEGLTQLTMKDLATWLSVRQDAHIITDIKSGNLEALTGMAETPSLAARIIPQVYRFHEYDEVRAMGFKTIILTLYLKEYPDEAVIEFAKSRKPLIVTMPEKRAFETNLPEQLTSLGVPVYVHTINDPMAQQNLKGRGISGIYTDILVNW